jgi:uncharacterized SAM-binding protein YcdF (DUF218 family)
MFSLLSYVLVWLLVAVLIYNLLLKVIPRAYLTLLGGFLLFAIIVLAFFFPNEPLVRSAWSVLSFPLKPVGATIILLGAALNQGLKNRNLIVAALLILLLSSIPIVTTVLARTLEQGEVAQVATTGAAVPNAGAIVVLGQGTTEPGLPPRTQIQLTDEGSDRIRRAAQLYRQTGGQPLVIASAGPEANDVATVLTQLGVPQDRIVVESGSRDLRTSAIEVNRILTARGIANQPVYLVTSAINSRRARLAYSQVGVQTVIQPADFVATEPGTREARNFNLSVQSFIPSVESLAVATRIVEEFYTTIYYSLRGWLAPTAA